jgi:hypothetical protein
MWALERGLDLDGVCIVGDGGGNTTLFSHVHREYARKKDKQLPVYFCQTFCPAQYAQSAGGNPNNFERFMAEITPAIPVTKFDMTRGDVDYFSIPNLVQGFSANRFGVIDKIMACPLVTLDMVLPQIATTCTR